MDHVEQYKIPKDPDKLDEDQLRILQEGCGPESAVIKTLVNSAPNQVATPPHEAKNVKVEKIHEEKNEMGKHRSRSPYSRRGADKEHSEQHRSPNHKNRSNAKERSPDHKQRLPDRYDKKKDKGERSHRRERSRDRDRDKDRKHRR